MDEKEIAELFSKSVDDQIIALMTGIDPSKIKPEKMLTANEMLAMMVQLRIGHPVKVTEHCTKETAYRMKGGAAGPCGPDQDTFIMHPDFAQKLLSH